MVGCSRMAAFAGGQSGSRIFTWRWDCSLRRVYADSDQFSGSQRRSKHHHDYLYCPGKCSRRSAPRARELVHRALLTQNSQSTAYTTVLGDAGKQIYHPGADTTARTWTIDSNANVAYSIGTCITFINDTSAGVVTIAITSDTLVLAGAGTTGSRTLAASNVATACKMTSTRWIISGSSGLT